MVAAADGDDDPPAPSVRHWHSRQRSSSGSKVGAHHHPYHRNHHHQSRDNDGSQGAALAARIHFPVGKDRAEPPRHGHGSPPRRHRGVPDAGTGTSASQPIKHRRFKDPIPPDQPLLGIALDDAAGHDPDQLFDAYRHDREHNERAREYLWTGRPMHGLMDVFFWWFLRVTDRMDRKLYSKVELDPHEQILDRLTKAGSSMGMCNYFADHMVPRGGFLVQQVEAARRDPNRWARRDQREEKWAAAAATGGAPGEAAGEAASEAAGEAEWEAAGEAAGEAMGGAEAVELESGEQPDGLAQEDRWRTAHIRAARQMWDERLRAAQEASEERERRKTAERRRSSRSRNNTWNHARRDGGPQSGRGGCRGGRVIIAAHFDLATRISKRGGSRPK